MTQRLLGLGRYFCVPRPLYIQPPTIKNADEAERPTYKVIFPEHTKLTWWWRRLFARRLRGVDGLICITPDPRASPPTISLTFDPRKEAADGAHRALVTTLSPTYKYTGDVLVQLEYIDDVPFRMIISLLIDGTLSKKEASELAVVIERWRPFYLAHDYRWDTLLVFATPTGYSKLPAGDQDEKENETTAARLLATHISMHCRSL